MATQRPYGQTYKLNAGPQPGTGNPSSAALLTALTGGSPQPVSGPADIASKSQAQGVPETVFGPIGSTFGPPVSGMTGGIIPSGVNPTPHGYANGPWDQRIDPMTGKPYPLQIGQSAADVRPDFTRNYLGMSADQTRGIERVAIPPGLDPNAFQIGNLSGIQAGYGSIFGNANQQQQLGNAAANAAQGNANQSRALALGALTAPGPSAAEAQLRQGGEAATRNALALARSGRGFGSGGQMRQAQFAGQEAMGAVNQQAATLRAQEEAQRRQQMLALTGMDVGQLGQEYQRQFQQGGLGLQALGGQGILSQAQQQALADQAKFGAGMQFDAAKTNANFANYEQPAQQDQTWSDVGSATGAAGGAMAGLAALMALSDRSSKTDIKPTTLADKFEGVGSHSYRYKDPTIPGAAPGRRTGPMADELRALGVTLPSADGYERVDTGRLSLANASATGELARRLKALEAKAA